jgi:molybdenum cofactor cytidylyltransferase
VLFDRATFPSFTGIEGDRGGRALFDHYPIHAIDADPRILTDIDTPDDLRALDPKT